MCAWGCRKSHESHMYAEGGKNYDMKRKKKSFWIDYITSIPVCAFHVIYERVRTRLLIR